MHDSTQLYEVFVLALPLLLATDALVSRGAAYLKAPPGLVWYWRFHKVLIFVAGTVGIGGAFTGLVFGPNPVAHAFVAVGGMILAVNILTNHLVALPRLVPVRPEGESVDATAEEGRGRE